MRNDLRAQKDLVIIFGAELRGADIDTLVKFGSGLGARFICLGDYANSRGAADMGLYPDLLPGYVSASTPQSYSEEWGKLPATAGLSLPEMMQAAKDGRLAALYVVGANPVADYSFDPAALENIFIVVQELFLTETASLAEVVLPAASAYEKAGTFTNTCGDLQVLKKAGDVAGVRSDFEIIVRVAERLGTHIPALVPFAKGVRADMGQSRGAQSGEADRHAVWLSANNLESRLSPFDPFAILDEIQRLVPGYEFSRINLLAGNDEHVTAPEHSNAGKPSGLVQIVPANDTLFTSGTLGRYSQALNSVLENRRTHPADKEVMAD
jgi:NADH-quinone oxidoreductase subunit G